MMRTMVLGVVLAGCAAKTSQVQLSMASELAEVQGAEFTPTWVELQHEDDGWIRVDVAANDQKLERLEDGFKARIGSAEVPAGKYLGARLGYRRMVEVGPEPVSKTITPSEEVSKSITSGPESKTISPSEPMTEGASGEAKMMEEEGSAETSSEFCLGKDGGTVVLNLADGGDAPKLTIEAPGC